jgi:Glycosyl hydrolase family 79 C-terminal beta domain
VVPRRAKRAATALAVLVGIGLGTAAIQGCSESSHRSAARPGDGAARSPARAQEITIGSTPRGRAVPPGFLGISTELSAVWAYDAGNPALLHRLIGNLDPGQTPIVRIGGDTTDRAFWPSPAVPRPPGARYELGPHWLAVVRRLADSLDARLILGVNLEAGSGAVAGAEARAFTRGLGTRRIDALELGNEPDLYSSFAWYRTPSGQPVTGRPAGYDFSAFTRDFVHVAGALPRGSLAGPALGTPPWTRHLGNLLAAEPRLTLLTLHRYPLQRCFTTPSSPRYPTIRNLLSPRSTVGLADGLIPAIRSAHRRGIGARLDEINSVACSGSVGVSDTFASALWALAVSFELARVGVDGVNFHTFPGAAYQLFNFQGTGRGRTAVVYPEYYGLMMFAQAAPPGSRLVLARQLTPGQVGAWATRDHAGTTRVALINDSPTRSRSVALRVPGTRGLGAIERLTASSLRATTGVAIGGQSFGAATSTGTLAGRPQETLLAPHAGRYVVTVPAASAALLTVPVAGVGSSVGDAAALSPGGQLQHYG